MRIFEKNPAKFDRYPNYTPQNGCTSTVLLNK